MPCRQYSASLREHAARTLTGRPSDEPRRAPNRDTRIGGASRALVAESGVHSGLAQRRQAAKPAGPDRAQVGGGKRCCENLTQRRGVLQTAARASEVRAGSGLVAVGGAHLGLAQRRQVAKPAGPGGVQVGGGKRCCENLTQRRGVLQTATSQRGPGRAGLGGGKRFWGLPLRRRYACAFPKVSETRALEQSPASHRRYDHGAAAKKKNTSATPRRDRPRQPPTQQPHLCGSRRGLQDSA